MARYRVGIDIGGTFTDLCVLDEQTGEFLNRKVSTTPRDLAQGVMQAVEGFLSGGRTADDVTLLFHASTVATNALLEQKGGKTWLVITEGYSGVYETPGGFLLYRAHEYLEQLVLDRDTLSYKQQVAQKYAQMVYDGLWFTPLRQALDCFIDKTQEVVSGKVTLKLYKGNASLAKMDSPFSLYDPGLGGFSDVDTYNQQDATGFIKCLGLPMKMRALLLGKKSNVKI